MHPFIVASFNAQSVKGNDMACKHCEIPTFITDIHVDLFFVTETWLSAQGDKTKTVELAPSGFDVKHSHVNRNLVLYSMLFICIMFSFCH